MTEQPETAGPPAEGPGDLPEGADTGRVRTGLDSVDGVIAAVEGLEERPIEEHVGVFEMAHDQLRRALDGPPAGEQPGPS